MRINKCFSKLPLILSHFLSCRRHTASTLVDELLQRQLPSQVFIFQHLLSLNTSECVESPSTVHSSTLLWLDRTERRLPSDQKLAHVGERSHNSSVMSSAGIESRVTETFYLTKVIRTNWITLPKLNSEVFPQRLLSQFGTLIPPPPPAGLGAGCMDGASPVCRNAARTERRNTIQQSSDTTPPSQPQQPAINYPSNLLNAATEGRTGLIMVCIHL